MRKIYFLILCTLFASNLFSQTTNFAIQNLGNGFVETIAINELSEATQFTVQFWINPSAKEEGANILTQNNLKIAFNNAGEMIVSDGNNVVTLNATIPLNKWSQITLVYKDGTVNVYLNNQKQGVKGNLATKLKATTGICRVAEGFKGQLDEFRIWRTALKEQDFFWRNTLNRFNPNYNDLSAYWKFDQDLSSNLVDYKLKYHGTLNDIQRVVVTDNTNFKYRVVSGYTSLLRFTDRGNINRDMFLMTNDVILLSLRVQQDGSLFPEYPDNSGIPNNVTYLDNYEGHNGVMNFAGTGAKMTAKSSHAPFKPNGKFANQATQNATFSGWFYIENWNEGAKLFSKYKDATHCIEVTLGNSEDKSIIVNLNGFKATLKNKLALNKWQYIGVYLTPTVGEPSNIFVNPITIGVDLTNYDRFSGVELSGETLNTTEVPILSDVPMVLGENFDGKMDEVMLWASDRRNQAKSDSENPIKLNSGNWNNIFLNAYWQGNDPEDVGKDTQSYLSIISHIKAYAKNYRGMKIRLGLIYPDGDKWHQVLNQKENVDRLIADAKKFLLVSDGLDVDLEWSYAQWQYNILNNVVRRLINEVMAGNRDTKIFTVSLHEVSYAIDKSLFDGIDYFTFQLYGPHRITYSWAWYQNAYQKFLNYGFPKDKIMLSYGILLVENPTEGYKELFRKYGMNDDNYDADKNKWNCNGKIKYFNGVNQTKRKQRLIIDNDLRGTMYFDMGNDLKVSDYKSLIRAQNDEIASNVDTIIREVKVPTSVDNISYRNDKSSLFTITKNFDTHKLYIHMLELSVTKNTTYSIFGTDGKLLRKNNIYGENTSVELQELPKGVYVITVSNGSRSQSLRFRY